jgi:3-deoxy-D-manno-octulosonic-acid transferase/heptosyltransferase-1
VYNCILQNRSGSLWQRVTSHVASFLRTLKKIREERYDLGIDLRAYFGNSVPLLYISGVRYIVGYGTGGFGFLLDKEAPYRTGVHEVFHVADLLKSIGIAAEDEQIRPFYKVSVAAEEQARRILESKGVNLNESFIMIGPGTGNKKKEWKIQNWRTLTKRLKIHGMKIVFCGGSDVNRTIKAILSNGDEDGIVDMSGSIPLEVFAGVVEKASLVIGLDSFPCHLAAALRTPTVVLWSGINDAAQWRPYGTNVRIVKRDVPCAPCYRSKGCEYMTCMDISPEDVLEMVRLQLGHETDWPDNP